MTRLLGFVVRNWPLKLAAIGFATLLYGGLVLSQTTQEFAGTVPIERENQPADVILLSPVDLGSVSRIRYVAPADLGLRVDSSTFRATVDLSDVDPSLGPEPVVVRVTAVDPRIQVLDFEPRRIVVTVDRVTERVVPIVVSLGPIPANLEVGDPVLDETSATVRGPDSIVGRVAEVRARVSVDPSGIDINQLVELVPVDDAGATLLRVDTTPTRVRVRLAVFTDRQTRTLPISPVVTGTPAAGFEIESVEVDPLVVSVEGDPDDLVGLERADTAPVSVSGASSIVVQTVQLALPDGVQALGSGMVTVTVSLRPVTATRTFEAGLALVGAQADKRYELSTDRVVVTIGGSIADLDRLLGATLILTVDVTGLEDGVYAVPVSANLVTGLTLLTASPNPVQVTVSSPVSSASPLASPSPTASPAT
ncbi:MAG TPA: CdaR family protein [Candidatus Deferrimicrobiaceae bacterium]|nr:CdaR family protein [Candidatus Deferrimicrobiaceae bacterium]